MYVQFWSTDLTVWHPHTVGSIKETESVQRRAARFTLGQYRQTSSVNAMLTRLNWEPLASRRHAARLLMFYKIHYGLVATPMPLDIKLHPVPTRVENSLAYHHIPPSSCDYHLYSFPPALFARVWNILPEAVVRASFPEVFRGMVHG